MTNARAEAPITPSTWAPLKNGVFRGIWFASLASNIGGWMQTVGAQWLLVGVPHAPLFVSLVQTADMAPDLLLGMVAGVIADTHDRRRVIIIAQIVLTAICGALTILTFAHRMTPVLLLVFTFALGIAGVPETPALQALIPDLVPRDQLPAASALSSVNINLARAIGPAIAGVAIAAAGVGAVFAANTVSFLILGLVIAAARPPKRAALRNPEAFADALRAGSHYVRNSLVVRRILLRATLFLVPASAMWALLPLIASHQLEIGAGGYGAMLGALGAGAVLGAFIVPPLRRRWSANALTVVGSLVFAGSLAAVVLIHNAALTLVVLVPAGIAWMGLLSGFNAAMQLFLPSWVRARGLSIYQMVFFGAQAAGAFLWGGVANAFGLTPTFLAAAGVMAAGALTVRLWPLIDTRGRDRSTAVYWDAPQLAIDPEPQVGPVVVSSTYTIAERDEEQFLHAMRQVRSSRLRTGAVQWGIFRDGEHPRRFVEMFVVPSWEEHLRQHSERQTGADREIDRAASSFSHPPPVTSHLLSASTED